MPPSADQSGRGQLPFRLWIGVSGHRHLPDDPRLVDIVRQALDRARRLAPSSEATSVRLGIVSSLAEGADRLLAWEVLQDPEAVLEAALPLPPDEYIKDFTAGPSTDAFHDLLGRASLVTGMPPAGNREQAYASAGRYVVDNSDVLIAVWDGEAARGTGGTAEAVQERKRQRRPLLVVSSTEPYTIRECFTADPPKEDFRETDAYNTLSLSPARHTAEIVRRWRSLQAAGLDDPELTSLRWWLPYLARAHCLAQRYQKLHRRLGVFLALGAGLAVATAAWALFSHSRLVPIGEASLLILLVLALLVGRHLRAHQRWIWYRSLVEQLRVALFIAVAGLGTSPSGDRVRRNRFGASLTWVGRAVEDLWATCPRSPRPTESAHGPLRGFLADAWIREQRDYHLRVARRYGRLDRLFSLAIYALFSATVLAALAHAARYGEEHWPSQLTYASVVLPALAGALEAIRAQRQWLPNKERSMIAAEALEGFAEAMERAPDATAIRAIARDVAIRTLEESSAWLGLMRFHDLELS
jgi:hypothetical protein